jgi:hypothetical protein
MPVKRTKGQESKTRKPRILLQIVPGSILASKMSTWIKLRKKEKRNAKKRRERRM